MKLSVICSGSRLDTLPRLRDVLDNLFVEYHAWYPRTEVQAIENIDCLEQCLDFSNYVLCMPGRGEFSTYWLHYTLGYQRGCTDRMAFWIAPEDTREVPEWLSRFHVVKGDEKDIYEYYAEVEELWCEETSADMARKAIRELDIEVSPRAFVESVQSGNRLLMGHFLEAGFNPSLRDASGVPVLNHAIRAGHGELFAPLLEAGADRESVAEDRGTTPIMEAAAAGLLEMTIRLIELGADLEHASRDGQTAVTLAVGNGRDESAIALIRGGANVDTKDLLGMSARKYAGLYNQKTILSAIAELE